MNSGERRSAASSAPGAGWSRSISPSDGALSSVAAASSAPTATSAASAPPAWTRGGTRTRRSGARRPLIARGAPQRRGASTRVGEGWIAW
jgi:hypothetical protein